MVAGSVIASRMRARRAIRCSVRPSRTSPARYVASSGVRWMSRGGRLLILLSYSAPTTMSKNFADTPLGQAVVPGKVLKTHWVGWASLGTGWGGGTTCAPGLALQAGTRRSRGGDGAGPLRFPQLEGAGATEWLFCSIRGSPSTMDGGPRRYDSSPPRLWCHLGLGCTAFVERGDSGVAGPTHGQERHLPTHGNGVPWAPDGMTCASNHSVF
jgi:hypothetical protein